MSRAKINQTINSKTLSNNSQINRDNKNLFCYNILFSNILKINKQVTLLDIYLAT